ncbi:SusC/RagA family TonB-linked outer membrane protein [Proteiniphilum acetatigenes]|uniref:SusC/RagA family TonB-linked outer membrane protein n=1 Tax=Proteiniphilum acetatigenes TaxID=294710 RepID=UPI0003717CC7|nr:TonB-dependent receptor [Proteiniphilum acetatigenes]SFL50796.1 TonB-linked outer membrane protein, SusC/RagA family [Porphyromonadaceae bacterium KH3CP3RA]
MKKQIFNLSNGVLFVLMWTLSLCLYAQGITVRGVVTDTKGEPLIGVTVQVEGTSTGTVTDIDGNFTLQNVPSNATLEVSYVGMTTQVVALNGRTSVSITLEEDAELLEEVVVIGYQTIRKADLTGSVSVFNPDEMKNTIVTGTVGDALGTLPGVTVRTAGAPGREGKVEIRGTGTFGNSTPLYVVDGVVSGANRDFNFNDIESIQVLKDASAAAIYGSRAGNGVIIITTKQGKEGKMKIDVSSRATMQWLPRYNLTNRDQWIELNDLAFANAGRQPANHFDGNTDWQEEVFKTGIVQDHNISFSGGNSGSRYFISGNYQHNSGTTIGTQSERFTLRSNTSATRDFGDNVTFRIGENITLSHFAVDELNTNPIVDVYRMLPTIPVYDENNAARGGYGYGDGSRDVTFGTNPFAKEDFEDTKNSNLRVRGNLFTELELLKALKYRFNLGFDFSNDRHSYLRKEGYWTYNQPYDPSSLNKNQAQYQGLVFDNTLEYNKKFGKHDISAVLGTSYFTSTYEQIWGTKNDVLMTSDGRYFDTLDAALSNPKTGNYRDLQKLFSVFGRVNYNYDERYLLSFTMRRDESSKFSPDNRVGYFPSVSAGWRISNEDFFESSWIDDLKIRANYGVLGNSNIGVWDWVSFITTFPQAVFGTGQNVHTGMTQIRLANNDLKWERLTQLNVGFDAMLLNNRLNLAVDYFLKETKDVLAPMQILMVTGNNGGNPYVNAVTLQNTGVELSATWRDRINSDFGYSINVNGSFLKNKITEIAYNLKQFTQWDTKSLPGEPIGEWYLIKTDGLFRTQEEVYAHTNSEGKIIQPDAKPGDVKYIDYNDDGIITDDDRQHCGSTIPKFELGMNLGFEYKNFDLQIQMGGAFGHKSFNGPRSAFDRFDDNSNYRVSYDPWTPENPNAKDPRPIYADSRNVRGNQDRWLENGSYLKVKQMALGYNLPKSMLGSTFSNIRVYVNAQNLITFTSYTGLDPEFLNTNIWDRSYDGGYFPNPYGVTFGAQISF